MESLGFFEELQEFDAWFRQGSEAVGFDLLGSSVWGWGPSFQVLERL